MVMVVMMVGCVQERQMQCSRQLETSSRPLSRIKLKLFGHSAVGKTALIEALRCGYLGGLLRLRSTFRSPSSSSLSANIPAATYRSTNPGMTPTYSLVLLFLLLRCCLTDCFSTLRWVLRFSPKSLLPKCLNAHFVFITQFTHHKNINKQP